jgi:hypothetical protein
MIKLLFLSFVFLGLFVNNTRVLAMEKEVTESEANSLQRTQAKPYKELTEQEISQRREALHIPEGMFAPKDVFFIIYTFTNNKIGLSKTCKAFYPWLEVWPLDLSLILPPTFQKLEKPFNLNSLKKYSDDQLYDLFLQITQPFTVSYDYIYVPTVLNLYFINYQALFDLGLNRGYYENQEPPAIMKFLKTPKGNIKILKVRDNLEPSMKTFIEKEGIEVKILPKPPRDSLPSFEGILKGAYLKEYYLDLLFDFYDEDDKNHYRDGAQEYNDKNYFSILERNKALENKANVQIRQERYDHITKDIADVLDAYKSIKNRYPRIHFKVKLRGTLLYFRDQPEKISLMEQILCSYLSPPDSFFISGDVGSCIEFIDKLNPECIKPLREFIPPYQKHHFENGFLSLTSKNRDIIEIKEQWWGITRYACGITRNTLFEDLSYIYKFQWDKQPVLLKRLFSLLNLQHVEQTGNQLRSCRLNDEVINALKVINESLLPLTDGDYHKFLVYLKNNKIEINPLEKEFNSEIKKALTCFTAVKATTSRRNH